MKTLNSFEATLMLMAVMTIMTFGNTPARSEIFNPVQDKSKFEISSYVKELKALDAKLRDNPNLASDPVAVVREYQKAVDAVYAKLLATRQEQYLQQEYVVINTETVYARRPGWTKGRNTDEKILTVRSPSPSWVPIRGSQAVKQLVGRGDREIRDQKEISDGFSINLWTRSPKWDNFDSGSSTLEVSLTYKFKMSDAAALKAASDDMPAIRDRIEAAVRN